MGEPAKRRKVEQAALAQTAPPKFAPPVEIGLRRPTLREIAIGIGCTVEEFAYACYTSAEPSLVTFGQLAEQEGGLGFDGTYQTPRFERERSSKAHWAQPRGSTADWLALGGFHPR